MPDPLCASLLAKIEEQIERTRHLIGLLPPGRLEEVPAAGSWTVSVLLGHLLECHAGVCAVLMAARPERLAHFAALRAMPVNHACAAGEALERLEIYRRHIVEGFAALGDPLLAQRLPTVFVAEGETVLTLLLGNLEHLINHKHQLFVSLKLLGVAVATADLYRLRGAE